MRYDKDESQADKVSEPAIKYGPSAIDQLLDFDGLRPLDISGDILDQVPKITNIPIFEIAEILEISKPNYYRKRTEDALDISLIDKLSSLLKLFKAGEDAFGSTLDFSKWLSLDNLHFGNHTPKVYLKTEQGRIRIKEAIGRIEHGIYG